MGNEIKINLVLASQVSTIKPLATEHSRAHIALSATSSTQIEEAAHGKILTCTGVGLGGWSPRWFSYLAGHFDPSGLGGAHVSSCDLLDPQVLCPLVGTGWAQTMKTTGCSSVMLKLFSPHQNQWNQKIEIKTNQKVKQKGKGRREKKCCPLGRPCLKKKTNKQKKHYLTSFWLTRLYFKY